MNELRKPTEDEINQALMTQRIIWGALLMGVVATAIVMYVIASDREPAEGGSDATLFLIIVLAFMAMELPIAFVMRTVIWKKAEINGAVPPQAYMTGNIIAWALAEGAAFMAIVLAFIGGQFIPNVWPAGIALAVLLALFPTGKPMRGKGGEYDRGIDS